MSHDHHNTLDVTVTINGEARTETCEARTLLVHFIREQLGQTGTHWGCDTSNCGVCVVSVDGQPVKSCTMLAAMADGSDIVTVEGPRRATTASHPIQEGFMECHGLQCGFCTPGMMIAAEVAAGAEPEPDRARDP